MKMKTLFTCLLMTFSPLAFSATWTSDAEVGVVITSGNSETQTANGKIKAARESEKWINSGSLEALRTSNIDKITDQEITTAEKYAANLKSEYKITDRDFVFANANYVDDRFSGFEFQATISLGYGRKLIKTDKQILSIELGPGIRFYKPSPDPITNQHIPSDSEVIARGAMNYIYNFSEQSKFTQDILVESGDEATITESVTALTARINGKMAMKASVKARHTSDVPVDTEKTDTETALTLVYSIK